DVQLTAFTGAAGKVYKKRPPSRRSCRFLAAENKKGGRTPWWAPCLRKEFYCLVAGGVVAAAAAATASAAGLALARFVDRKRAALQVLAVHALNRGTRFARVVHFDEAETAGAAGLTIIDDAGFRHGAVGFEGLAQFR